MRAHGPAGCRACSSRQCAPPPAVDPPGSRRDTSPSGAATHDGWAPAPCAPTTQPFPRGKHEGRRARAGHARLRAETLGALDDVTRPPPPPPSFPFWLCTRTHPCMHQRRCSAQRWERRREHTHRQVVVRDVRPPAPPDLGRAPAAATCAVALLATASTRKAPSRKVSCTRSPSATGPLLSFSGLSAILRRGGGGGAGV